MQSICHNARAECVGLAVNVNLTAMARGRLWPWWFLLYINVCVVVRCLVIKRSLTSIAHNFKYDAPWQVLFPNNNVI